MDDAIRPLLERSTGELFGWPTSLLDELWKLRQAAYTDSLSIHEWRRRDAALRSTVTTVTPADRAQLEALHEKVTQALYGNPRFNTEDHAALSLLQRRLLAARSPAPDDDELREELRTVVRRLRGHQLTPEARALFEQRRQRLRRWLSTSPDYDVVTGLPWALLGRYRWTVHPALGLVPTYLDEARRLAVDDPANAAAVAAARDLHEDGLRSRLSSGMTRQHSLVESFVLVADAARESAEFTVVADRLARLWNEQTTLGLLLQITAPGWPGFLAALPPPARTPEPAF